MRNFKMERVSRLRKMKVRGSVLPNVKAKLWATRICDEIYGKNFGIECKNEIEGMLETNDLPPLQKQREEGYCIVGTDVVLLFPSLKEIENSRIGKQAVMESNLKFENVDYMKA